MSAVVQFYVQAYSDVRNPGHFRRKPHLFFQLSGGQFFGRAISAVSEGFTQARAREKNEIFYQKSTTPRARPPSGRVLYIIRKYKDIIDESMSSSIPYESLCLPCSAGAERRWEWWCGPRGYWVVFNDDCWFSDCGSLSGRDCCCQPVCCVFSGYWRFLMGSSEFVIYPPPFKPKSAAKEYSFTVLKRSSMYLGSVLDLSTTKAG